MRKNYDFTTSDRNPFTRRMKRQITISVNKDTIAYFKNMAQEHGVPYQSLINLYLADCAASNRKLQVK